MHVLCPQLVSPFMMEFLGTFIFCLTITLCLGNPPELKPMAPFAIGITLV